MNYQMRNWYYFTWLSGDFNVEQHVHFLDVCAWVMKDQYPVKAVGMGGRQVRTGPEYGHIYDHFSVVYEYADGAKLFSNCRQQPGCKNDMSVQVAGHAGAGRPVASGARACGSSAATATGSTTARRTRCTRPSTTSCSPASATASRSTTASTWPRARCWRSWAAWPPTPARQITWEMALNSKEDLSPARYDWDAAPPAARDRRAGADAVRLTGDRSMEPMEHDEADRRPRRPRTAAPGSGRRGGRRARRAGRRLRGRGRSRRGDDEPPDRARQADPVPDRLHDPALLRSSRCERALTGIKAAGYRYVAWGTTHQEADGKQVPVIAADAPPDRAKELGKKCRDLGLEPLMMFSGIYPEAPDGARSPQAAASARPRRRAFRRC